MREKKIRNKDAPPERLSPHCAPYLDVKPK